MKRAARNGPDQNVSATTARNVAIRCLGVPSAAVTVKPLLPISWMGSLNLKRRCLIDCPSQDKQKTRKRLPGFRVSMNKRVLEDGHKPYINRVTLILNTANSPDEFCPVFLYFSRERILLGAKMTSAPDHLKRIGK